MTKLLRQIDKLAKTEFDLVVVGGGIFGACATWEAARRGLKVVLLEKTDFSHATSANHFKMVHGGIRYLQHGDFVRIRESAYERSALLRIAPHLVKPLPIVIPTYGHGIKGKEILWTAVRLFDLLTWDRNRGLLPESKIPTSGVLSRSKVLAMFPGIKQEGLTGGALFHDGQMVSPTRLAICFLRSAVAAGAAVANYVEVKDLVRSGNRIQAVNAIDRMSSRPITVRGRMILNATGPWADHLLEAALNVKLNPRPTFSRDLAFVVPKRFKGPYALAFATESRDQDTLLDRGGRHLFAVPWKDYTLVGVWHKVFKGSPEYISVSEKEMTAYLEEVNHGYPSLQLRLEDVQLINTGLTLFGEEKSQSKAGISFGKRSMLIDHLYVHGLEGLLTLIGVRATTARGMSEKAVDLVFKHLQKRPVKSKTSRTAIYGGDISSFSEYAREVKEHVNGLVSSHQVQMMMHHYGSGIFNVMRYGSDDKSLLFPLKNSDVLKAEIVHAIHEEAAFNLADVVFRRTDLATGRLPAMETLMDCADVMADHLGWDHVRVREEIDRVTGEFPNFMFKFKDRADR